MTRRNRKKPKEKLEPSQRTSHLKAMALTKVARQAWNQNLRYKTIALLTEALRREPSNPEILIELATACGKQRHYDRAETLLARLTELAPRSASIYRRVATAYSIIDRPEQAAEYFRRSLELNRDSATTASTLIELAGLYERSHKLADAQQLVTEALEREPENERALLLEATLDRRRGNVAGAESRFRDLLTGESHDTSTRAQAGYELAQLLDDNEQYGEAFKTLLAAKQLMRPHANSVIQQKQMMLDKNREMLAMLDRSCFERWRDAAMQDAPCRLAVLTSHPRSGTTLIEQVLDSHGELQSADEFDVFSQWIHQPIFRRFHPSIPVLSVLERVPALVRQQARSTYWQQTEAIFNRPLGSHMLLDKNPGMTVMLPVVNWAFPEMKILYALRDPRDVVLSCFMQKVPLTPISSAWLSLNDAGEYYARTMETWLKVRDLTTSSWLEFRYESVVENLENEARRILEFLGLNWDEKVLQFHEHAKDKVVRSPTYKDVTKPIYNRSIGRWHHYAEHLEPILARLKPFLAEFKYD